MDDMLVSIAQDLVPDCPRRNEPCVSKYRPKTTPSSHRLRGA
jgi:hypothetical protein